MRYTVLLCLFVVCAFGQGSEPAVLASASSLRRGLVGYWRLEEASGTRYDRSKNGNHLTSMNSVGQSSGKQSFCAKFSSVSTQYLIAPSPAGIPSGVSELTMTAWVNMTNKPSSGQTRDIAGKWDFGSVNKRSFFVNYFGTSDRFIALVSSNGVASTILTANTFGSASAGTWYFICFRYDRTNCYISVNNGSEDSVAWPNGLFNTGTNAFTIGAELSNGVPGSPPQSLIMNGFIDEVGLWNRSLSASEITRLYNTGTGTTFPRFQSSLSPPTLNRPQSWEIFQRHGTNADILITGNVGTGTHTIEARFNGGSWTAVATNASGIFSGTLASQVQGQGDLSIRWADNTSFTATANNVGIGDVFAVAGQSNAMGFGSNNQAYATSSALASNFALSYLWGNLTDPVSSNSGQVDSIFSDANARGSVWPLVATRFLTNQSVPVAFIPCASDGSSITQWQPSGALTNRSSLLGATSWRSQYAVAGIKAVLWWQGETDALASMAQNTYFTNYTNFSANLASVTGVQVMPCKLQNCTGLTGPQESAINAAITNAWAVDSHTLTGPDLFSLTTDDGFHLRSDTSLASAAELWWNAIRTAFY